MRIRRTAALVAALALSLPLVIGITATSAQAAEPFGPGCAALPTGSAAGSAESMAKEKVADAAASNPELSTLVTAVTQAKLGDTLNNAQDITVFAPTDAAFAKVPAEDLKALLADDAALKQVLTYHVVPQTLTPDNISGSHKTLEGSELTVEGGGTDWTVNGTAKVVCGNVETANATVYLIDGVLMPQ